MPGFDVFATDFLATIGARIRGGNLLDSSDRVGRFPSARHKHVPNSPLSFGCHHRRVVCGARTRYVVVISPAHRHVNAIIGLDASFVCST